MLTLILIIIGSVVLSLAWVIAGLAGGAEIVNLDNSVIGFFLFFLMFPVFMIIGPAAWLFVDRKS